MGQWGATGQGRRGLASRSRSTSRRDLSTTSNGERTIFERLNTPEEAYNYKLGAALTMEETVLGKILEHSLDEAQDASLKRLFRHHAEETSQQIRNLERVFAAFGWDVAFSPCPTIDAIHKEGKANVRKAGDAMVDSIILSGAAETEHHEIAVYETLIRNAYAMGRNDVVGLLHENLQQEKHTLDEINRLAAEVAAAT